MEIVEHLIKELGVSTKQAEGGAGLLLELFVQVADTIPAISDVIGKAPRLVNGPIGPVRELLSRWFSGLGNLGVLAPRFEKLGCDKMMIRKFADAMIGFFREKGGDEIAGLLRRALS